MPRALPILFVLAACAGPDLPDLGRPPPGPAPALAPVAELRAAAGADLIAPADDAALAARAAALRARAARLVGTPVSGPPVP